MGKRGRAAVTAAAMMGAVLNAMCGGGSSASAPGPDSGDGDAGTADSGGSSSSGGSGSGGSSSGTSSGGGSSSGAPEGGIQWAYTPPAADLGPTATLAMGGFNVDPGAEVYRCEVFANPFSGKDTDIVRAHSVISAGSHRFIVFSVDPATTATEPPVGTIGNCVGQGLEFHPYVHFAQQPDWTTVFPGSSDGSPTGYPLAGTRSLMTFAHYLNLTSSTIAASAVVDLVPAKAGIVKTHVGNIMLVQTTMSVPTTATMQNPSQSPATWPGDPTLPANYAIISSWHHMVTRALAFEASTGDAGAFYSDPTWDAPGLFLHAPGVGEPATATGTRATLQMTNTSPISWSCSYYNDTEMLLGFGDSAVNNTWCVYMAQYYPASSATPDIISVSN